MGCAWGPRDVRRNGFFGSKADCRGGSPGFRGVFGNRPHTRLTRLVSSRRQAKRICFGYVSGGEEKEEVVVVVRIQGACCPFITGQSTATFSPAIRPKMAASRRHRQTIDGRGASLFLTLKSSADDTPALDVCHRSGILHFSRENTITWEDLANYRRSPISSASAGLWP